MKLTKAEISGLAEMKSKDLYDWYVLKSLDDKEAFKQELVLLIEKYCNWDKED